MNIIVKDGWIIDPSQAIEGMGHILIEDGKIKRLRIGMDFETFCRETGCPETGRVKTSANDEKADAPPPAGRPHILDASGRWVMPGFVDLHVHLRDPGQKHKEDMTTGCRAAASGGVSTLCCMPNTAPVTDSREAVEYIKYTALKNSGGVHVLPVGAITSGQEGKEPADYAGMVAAGIRALSEDGKTVMDEDLMRHAMQEAAGYDIPVFSHTEDHRLSGGSMHESELANRYGVKGIPAACEENIVARDISLAEVSGCRLHLCHISTAGSVTLIRDAKKRGVAVTAEATPHHFTLSVEDIVREDGSLDANKKMNPPLRSAADVKAVREALAEGIIDAIATDHAPHQDYEKDADFAKAPFGSIGLETSFAVAYTELVKTGILTPAQLVDRMSSAPAKIVEAEAGSLEEGMPADIVIADIAEKWTIGEAPFLSKSRNTPFAEKSVYGKIICTIAGGEVIFTADHCEAKKHLPHTIALTRNEYK